MTALNSPDLYFVAIAPREIEFIEEAFPAVPNSCNLLLTTSFIASLESNKYLRGSNCEGFSWKYFLTAAVAANLKSVSTLTFLTPCFIPS